MSIAPAVLATVLAAAPAFAHPGVGIVMDSRGHVYYTDLRQVWRIAPDGSKTIAVPNVHTHELCIDAEDQLYGEHLWYEGEATDRWGHRVWRRSPDGRVVDVIAAREGFLTNYSFVRDAAGAMYWPRREGNPAILKRLPDGEVALLASADFEDIRWMTVTPEGVVYLIDDDDLIQVLPDGSVRALARDLRERSRLRALIVPPGRHDVMGLWTDAGGSVYVAVASGRVVKKVGPSGRVTIVARSRWPWAPTGGMVAPSGDLWLLETSTINTVRVRRIAADGRITVF